LILLKDLKIESHSAFLFSLSHVLWHYSTGIVIDLLLGNLPACFMQLRFLMETAAQALLVDYKFKFQENILIEAEDMAKALEQEATSISKLFRKLSDLNLVDKEVADDVVKLWNRISNEWLHFIGFLRRIKKLIKYGDLQSYREGLPIVLSRGDTVALNDLAECIAHARRLLKAFYSSWLKLLEKHLPEAAKRIREMPETQRARKRYIREKSSPHVPSYWTLSGMLENWMIALEKGVWGVGERAKGLWAKVQPGDVVVFYATGRGVIGYGVVEGKFESGEPLWPKEKEEGKVIWPYRIKIRVERVFERPKPRPKGMLVAFAINKLGEEAFNELLR